MRKDEAKFITEFLSEAGTKAENNDYFGYVLLDNYAIWAVADGFDEEEGAKVAARIAVESAIEYFMLRPRFNYDVIKEMMDYANLKVKEKQEETQKYSLMHTSLLIIISNYNSILYGNIGNTRFYHIRGGYIISQSRDDTIAQLLVDEEALNISDMRFHRQRNDLLQAIGDFGKIKPNIIKKPVELIEKDVFCLTTVGFWENIDEHDMENDLSRFEDKKQWLNSLEKRILASLRDNIENYTIAQVEVGAVASPEPMEKDKRKLIKKIILVMLIIVVIILFVIIWNVKRRNGILQAATQYEKLADEEILKKNFNNSIDNLKLEIGEYEKLKPKNKGIIGFLTNAEKKRADASKKIDEINKKIGETEKIKKAFSDINEGNEMFNSGNYDEANVKYQQAKYNLNDNSYKRDELNTEEILTTLDSRINSTVKLKEAKALEVAGDTAVNEGSYNLAKVSYKNAADMYLANGRADYVSQVEKKLEEITDKEKTAYNGAMLAENKGDSLAQSNINSSKEAYYQARQMYQALGDTVKVGEIDNKIQELHSQQNADLQTANNLVQEGLSQITANNPAQAINILTQAKNIYQKMKDTNNANAVSKYINQAQEFIKFESQNAEKLKTQEMEYSERLRQQEIQMEQQLQIKEAEIKAQQEEMERERQRREEITRKMENASNMETQADQLAINERFEESISKYEETKKLLEEVNADGNFGNQMSKIEDLNKKIEKNEGYLLKRKAEEDFKNKKWKEAVEKFTQAKEKLEKSGTKQNEIAEIEKKLKKAEKKANKKWWQFWKIF
ncbi:PP2C family serine/threonine-protein phosphatase [Leptotrichia sp. oral taxon 879]|uniref:PP2C family protein-serine/threonine phosphatase n=1 Tax=Leptotrichia sp. oral taxon 879 TaxID=1227267 RepID=UPI0003ADCAAF|nr:protein phosphatase 2C domain-containing protein [Leptotrichia sp. oral taxon 879]ERK49290.1 tetratricopeptide repeat protein [Leptotrichia sp. oral taxon 879 str. F0557]